MSYNGGQSNWSVYFSCVAVYLVDEVIINDETQLLIYDAVELDQHS